MSRRSGQRGNLRKVNGWWVLRFWQDVRGAEKRKRPAIRIAPCEGPGCITHSEAQRRGAEKIRELGIDTPEYFLKVNDPIETFAEKAAWVRGNDPAFLEGRPGSVRTMNTALDKHILPLLGHLPIDQVTERRVQEFIAYLKSHIYERRAKDGRLVKRYKLSHSTVKTVVKAVKRVLGKRAWVDWELKLGRAPDRIPQRYFTEAQMDAIVDGAAGIWKVFFATLRGSGIRIGECCGLDAADVDLENQIVYIQRQFSQQGNMMLPPKSKKGYREIDIDAGLTEMLRQHLNGRACGLVFSARNGQPFRGGNIIRSVLNPILRKLGIPTGGKLLHAFRHGRTTVLRKNGVPDDLQLQWIGHSSLEMNQRYTHTDQEMEYRKLHAARVGIKVQ